MPGVPLVHTCLQQLGPPSVGGVGVPPCWAPSGRGARAGAAQRWGHQSAVGGQGNTVALVQFCWSPPYYVGTMPTGETLLRGCSCAAPPTTFLRPGCGG